MYSYCLIWCGPVNTQWIEDNGDNWSGGRIEVLHSDHDYAVTEYSVMIDSKDWMKFDDFLWDLETTEQKTREELFALSGLDILEFRRVPQ